nr:ATPase family AAA domain-containing protein 5-like [Procambarus clarkii]XP_045622028.1 ATPase family AAA domain-containing protein 5-like [Procambarus clarkii]XP_045622029.1 ATPase family AAA domain-containing protein 5-like [Procambarus clarkii]
MSTAVDIQDILQHERRQMGSKSYYECPQEIPSGQAEEKKDILMYFKKVARTPVVRKPTESQSKCNSCCKDDNEVIVISPEIKTNSDSNRNTKYVSKDGQKTNCFWNSRFMNNYVNQEESSPDIEILVTNKKEKVNFDKELNSNQGTASHPEISHLEILDVNISSTSKTKEEFQSKNNKLSSSSVKDKEILSDTPKKKTETNLLDKVEPKLSDMPKMEETNIFAVMMANRRKQNEILKELNEKENLNKVDDRGGKILDQSSSKLQECIEIISNSEDESDLTDGDKSCGLGIVMHNKAAGTDSSQSLKLWKNKVVKGNDVFKIMMANRHRLDKQQSPIKNVVETCDPISEVHPKGQAQEKHIVLSEINTGSDKGTGCIKKRKREELDSSLQDFDLTVNKGKKKRRKLSKKCKGIPNNSDIGISEKVHVEREGEPQHGEMANNIIRNKSSAVSQSGFDETEKEKTSSNCISVSFTDFMKQALDRERVKDSKINKSEEIVEVDSEKQSMNERTKGTYGKDGKDIGHIDKNITQCNKIRKTNCDIGKNVYINDTSKVDAGGTDIKKPLGKVVDNGGADIKKPGKLLDDGCADVKSPGKLLDDLDDRVAEVKKPGKRTKRLNSNESQRKRKRKKINCIIDSDDGSCVSDMAETPCDQNLSSISVLKGGPCSQEEEDCSKKNGIPQFFKKISKEEKSVERSKNVFTVKADVHAPDSGVEARVSTDNKGRKSKICDRQGYNSTNVNKENMSESHSKGCSRRLSKRIKRNQELEDLNKIELLEQIVVTASPKKSQANSLRLISSSEVEEHKTSEVDALVKKDKRSPISSGCSSSDIIQMERNTTKKATKSLRKVLKASQDQNAVYKKVLNDEKESCLEMETSDEDRLKMAVPVSKEKSKARIPRKKNEVQESVSIEDKDSDNNTTVRRSLRRRSELKGKKSCKISGKNNKGDINSSCLPPAESICDISSDSLLGSDGAEELGCTSTQITEDDKENRVKYTSTLDQKPGKLRLKIRRIKHASQHVKKRRSLSLKQNNTVENQVQKKTKKLLQKAKGTRKVIEHQKKKKAFVDHALECVDKHDILVNMALTNSDVVIINDTSSFVDDKIKSPKKTKKRKSSQVLLKPLPAGQARRKLALKNKKVLSKKAQNTGKKLEDAKEKGKRSQRPSRQAAIGAKKALDQQRKILEAEEGEKKNRASRKDAVTRDTKLAPIFCKKSKSPCVEVLKVVLSPSKLKARQDFLQSGVPDEIKKQVFIEKSQEEELNNWPPFPEVSHVQQKTDEALWKLDIPKICLRGTKQEDYNPTLSVGEKIFPFTTSLSKKTNSSSRASLLHMPTLDLNDIASLLANMKSQNPNFPVYKVFKSYYDMKKEAVELYKKELEKERMEEHDIVILDDDDDTKVKKKRKRKNKPAVLSRSKRSKLGNTREQSDETACMQTEAIIPLWHEKTPHSWTQIFAPKNGKQVIGNTEHVRRLKMWLQEWKRKCQAYANKEKSKKIKSFRQDDSFEESDGSSSWDEDDFVNTYLLCGPPGIGKTAAVYALAAELGYKVLEVNASSRRPGRQVMSQLVEATQSHSVANNSSSQPSNTLTTMLAAKNGGSASKATSLCIREESQESSKDFEKRKDVSLVLFKDIDVVFEEWDDGFLSTVNNFMATSKRPIVLTVNNASPSVFSRIKGTYDKMEFVSPSEDCIAQHLQLVCLANGYHICSKDLESLINTNKGDIRQSILDLQLLANSGSSHDLCDCGMQQMADTSISLCENNLEDCRTHDLSLNDVFPEETNIKLKDVKLYKAGVCGKLQATSAFNGIMSALKLDKQLVGSDGSQTINGNIAWSQVADNISYILPFPLKKKVNKVQRYPLCASDPLLRVTNLWQRCNWLSIDEDEDDSQPDVIEEKEEVLDKIEVPQSVQNASKLCLNSMANLYDTFTQLDILNSSQCLTRPKVQIKEHGWWIRQPTAGLSDEQGCSSPHWAPFEVLNDITHELGHRALIQCSREISSGLKEVSPRDWPQLCLSSDFKYTVPSLPPHLSPDDSERSSHWNLMGSIVSSLPLVNQLNRSISLEYLPTLRSICRHDELGVALSKKRRGRRFLSQMAQLGFDISLPDKLKMANAMVT